MHASAVMQMADFVMPNFDFIVGVSICFALGKRRAFAPGEGRIKTACSATGKVANRAIMLYPYANIWHAQKEGCRWKGIFVRLRKRHHVVLYAKCCHFTRFKNIKTFHLFVAKVLWRTVKLFVLGILTQCGIDLFVYQLDRSEKRTGWCQEKFLLDTTGR